MQTHQLHRWQVNTMGARARLRTCEICHLSCTYFKSRRQYASVQEKAASKTTLALYSGGKQQCGSANHLIGRVSKSFRESRIHIFQTSFLLHSHIHLSSECAKYYKDGCTLQSGCSCRERKPCKDDTHCRPGKPWVAVSRGDANHSLFLKSLAQVISLKINCLPHKRGEIELAWLIRCFSEETFQLNSSGITIEKWRELRGFKTNCPHIWKIKD